MVLRQVLLLMQLSRVVGPLLLDSGGQILWAPAARCCTGTPGQFRAPVGYTAGQSWFNIELHLSVLLSFFGRVVGGGYSHLLR